MGLTGPVGLDDIVSVGDGLWITMIIYQFRLELIR